MRANAENGKAKNDSPLSVIASVISIFVFITGLSSLPSALQWFGVERANTLSESPSRFSSYGLLLISQVVYVFCLFIISRFFYPRLCAWLHIKTSGGRLFLFVLFLIIGWTVSFMFAEAFFGPSASWTWAELPKSHTVAAEIGSAPAGVFFCIASFFAVIFTIAIGVGESTFASNA